MQVVKYQMVSFISNLLFLRSKPVLDLMCQPRAELFAPVLNAQLESGYLENYYQGPIELIDSQTMFHWIRNSKKLLK